MDREPSGYQRFVYRLDFVMYPTIVALLFLHDGRALLAHPLKWALMFAFGFIVWTLAEYWIHRSVLHGPYWMGIHERHHVHPREQVAFPIWQIPMYFTAIFGLVGVSCGPWTPPVFAGVLVGWIIFFMMHHFMHSLSPATLAEWPWLQDFARRHNLHHKVTAANYGITTDLWDRVFRTYRPVRS